MSVPSPRNGAARRDKAQHASDRYVSRTKTDAVVAWFGEQRRDDNGDIVASQRDVSAGTGISLPTVRRALRALLDAGDLVLVALGTGYPYSSRYRLRGDLVATDPAARDDAASVPVA